MEFSIVGIGWQEMALIFLSWAQNWAQGGITGLSLGSHVGNFNIPSTHKGRKIREAKGVKKSKLDNPDVKKKVIQGLVLRKIQRSIAKEVGVSQPQVSRFASRDDIKLFLEEEFMRLVEIAPDALDNVVEAVKDKIKDIPKDNIKRRKFVFDASIDVLKAVEIMPTNVQSQVITRFYQQNMFLSPLCQEVIHNHLESLQPFDKQEEEAEKDGVS